MAVEVIVAGCPRTGTSFTMSVMEALGYSVGDKKHHKTPDEHNPYGYYEDKDVMDKEIKVSNALGFKFADPQPVPINWYDKAWKEVDALKRTVNARGMQAIKPIRGWVLGDVWRYMFPEAKWVYTTRNARDTHRSRFGKPVEYEQWANISNRRNAIFRRSNASKKALFVAYEDWGTCFDLTVMRIVQHLGITRPSMEEVRKLWRPRKRSE